MKTKLINMRFMRVAQLSADWVQAARYVIVSLLDKITIVNRPLHVLTAGQ